MAHIICAKFHIHPGRYENCKIYYPFPLQNMSKIDTWKLQYIKIWTNILFAVILIYAHPCWSQTQKQKETHKKQSIGRKKKKKVPSDNLFCHNSLSPVAVQEANAGTDGTGSGSHFCLSLQRKTLKQRKKNSGKKQQPVTLVNDK